MRHPVTQEGTVENLEVEVLDANVLKATDGLFEEVSFVDLGLVVRLISATGRRLFDVNVDLVGVVGVLPDTVLEKIFQLH